MTLRRDRRLESTFDSMVHECAPRISTYAHTLCADSWTAEEVIQETFIRAWRYWPTFRGESSALTWLAAICRNVAVDVHKRQRHDDPLPEVVIDARDHFAQSHVLDLIDKLPPQHREVITLCALHGMSYDHAADVLGIPVGTVRSRLARARERLSTDMADARAV